ncbi:haloalkane dehalogenase [Paraburkholderia sp. GAS32]|uniref:haloalkane dehalogenase n=1 Tax=Paraburkholderia sp. GAS32 TaxID=3035129 RepID=UPI003D249107
MRISAEPYGCLKTAEVNGLSMAYIDEGVGDAIVFQHGNPTSSYLWRNVMPHCEGLGRLIACDLIGMGNSEKLPNSGPGSYHYQEQRDYLFALWDRLALGDRIILVLHDWGSVLGFDWARQHPDRVAGIVYMEAIVAPFSWSNWPEARRSAFRMYRSEEGERVVLQDNMFIEWNLPRSIKRQLTEQEMDAYREPFAVTGEDRRPTLSWPRNIPIDGEPPHVTRIVEDYGQWLAQSNIPKLFINAEPGVILTEDRRDFCRTWPNQTEITVEGLHFIQEDSPHTIGHATAEFARSLRAA